MKFLALAVARHGRRYKRICSKYCSDLSGNVRMLCVALCIRYVKRCDAVNNPSWASCANAAAQAARDAAESLAHRVTV